MAFKTNPFTGKFDYYEAGTGLTDAPSDGTMYGRKDGAWERITLLPPVYDWWDTTGGLPPDPSDGDRYAADGDGSGWTDGYIYEWDATTSTWIESEPEEGWMFWMLFELIFWVFFSGGWMEVGSGTYLKLDCSNDPLTGALTINNDSTTGLLVEQDGVHDNVFVVDTDSAKVGINKVPQQVLDIAGVGNGGVLINASNTIANAQSSGFTGLLIREDLTLDWSSTNVNPTFYAFKFEEDLSLTSITLGRTTSGRQDWTMYGTYTSPRISDASSTINVPDADCTGYVWMYGNYAYVQLPRYDGTITGTLKVQGVGGYFECIGGQYYSDANTTAKLYGVYALGGHSSAGTNNNTCVGGFFAGRNGLVNYDVQLGGSGYLVSDTGTINCNDDNITTTGTITGSISGGSA